MVVKLKKVVFDSINGLAIYPFIFVKEGCIPNGPFSKIRYSILINHEKIHLSQEKELLILPFYLWYLIEWSLKSWKYKSWSIGYRNISFEREAYSNEGNLDYRKNRKLFSFLKYL